MRLLSKVLWFLAFLASTFCWMVLFEHGFSMEGFSQGLREEWTTLTRMVGGKEASAEEPRADKTPTKPTKGP